MTWCTAAFVIGWAATASVGATIYVDDSAPPGGSGGSWGDPLNSLQAALAAAGGGDEIRVGQGMYKPGPPGAARTVTFAVPAGVAVRGGYAGFGAAEPGARDVDAFPTVLSGDLLGDDTPGFGNDNDNVFHVVTISGGDAGTVLDGLVVRAGRSSGTSAGGGLRCVNTAAVVSGCAIVANHGDRGAGVGISGGGPRFVGCTFTGNMAHGAGAGAHCEGATAAVFDGCIFRANRGGAGAGAFNTGGSTARYERCVFADNLGDLSGGSGTGVSDWGASSSLIGCSFTGNITDGGGGGVKCINADTFISGCVFVGNDGIADGGGGLDVVGGHPVVVNCLFSGNVSSLASGHAIIIDGGSTAEVINCTVVNNGRPGGLAAVRIFNSTPQLVNSIVWNNRDASGTGQGSQVFGGTPQIVRCCIQGWTGSLGGEGNTGIAPWFTDLDGADNVAGTADDDARLAPGSVGIDAGDTTKVPAAVVTDLDGSPRLRDDPGSPDGGVGGPGGLVVDMGCYEFQEASCYANCDGSVVAPVLNVSDFACFLSRFAAGDVRANCDGSTAVPALNVNDFMCFQSRFAEGCP